MNLSNSPARPKILSVGQCGFDGPNIERVLMEHFNAEVVTACDSREALDAADTTRFDLVLVNRMFDGNGESGLDFIGRFLRNSSTKQTPIMLVSNYADAQQTAVKLGARPGFGKAALQSPQTIDRLTAVLRGNPPKTIHR